MVVLLATFAATMLSETNLDGDVKRGGLSRWWASATSLRGDSSSHAHTRAACGMTLCEPGYPRDRSLASVERRGRGRGCPSMRRLGSILPAALLALGVARLAA